MKSSRLSWAREVYTSDPLYFQRLVTHAASGRFKSVRMYLAGREKEGVYPTLVGTLGISDRSREDDPTSKRFDSFTEWYNHMTNEKRALKDISIFSKIHLSKRVTVESLLLFADQYEIDEFIDRRFMSHQIYKHVYRRLLQKGFQHKWSRDHEYTIEWNRHVYDVGYSYINPKTCKSVIDIFQAFQQNCIGGLYCLGKDKETRIPLSEYESCEKPELEPTPEAFVPVQEPTPEPVQEPVLEPTPVPVPPPLDLKLEPLLPLIHPSTLTQMSLHIQALASQVQHLQSILHTQGIALAILLQNQKKN